jgi:hypothetical protein
MVPPRSAPPSVTDVPSGRVKVRSASSALWEPLLSTNVASSEIGVRVCFGASFDGAR